ncbi:MAG: copper export protein [Cenarchaeum symbiont of Oopsacas minuta]|nr:copper export protein [Cenarchaeum symbiont of Oopsacas minuta]
MSLEQTLITWAHLVSAAIWVGGGLFLGTVLAPVLKNTSMSMQERMGLMIKVGRRFNVIAIPSLAILIVTGLYNSRLILTKSEILFDSEYGILLLIKMVLVLAVIIVYAIHVRIIRGEIEKKVLSTLMLEQEVQTLRKKIIILGEAISIMSVAILFLAAALNSGL